MRVEKVHIYTDGASRGNPGNAGIGFLLTDSDGKELEDHKEYIGETTNNVAEYTALLKALEAASDYTDGEVVCHSDSQLMVKQLQGEYGVKAPHLKELYEKAVSYQDVFETLTFKWHRRENDFISKVDSLANEALDKRY